MKSPNLVKEWLTEFKNANDNYSRFYNKYHGNIELYTNVINGFKNQLDVEAICIQLYSFGLIKDIKMNVLLLDILPRILNFYLIASLDVNTQQKLINYNTITLRSCLISVRNLLRASLCSKEERSNIMMPVFTDGSIYHSLILSPDIDAKSYRIDRDRSHKSDETECDFVSDLIKLYNYHFNSYSKVSLIDFCDLSLRIVSLISLPRVAVTTRLLSELTVILNFLLFKEEHAGIALEVLSAMENRANYEFMAQAILTVSAIRHQFYNRRQTGCFIAMDTMTHNRANSVNEAVITNASFRPEKVSEDIKAFTQIINFNNSAEFDFKDIGLTFTSLKTSSKSKIKFNLIDNFLSNNDDAIINSVSQL